MPVPQHQVLLERAACRVRGLQEFGEGPAEERQIREAHVAAFGQQEAGQRLHRDVGVGDTVAVRPASDDQHPLRSVMDGGIQ